MITILICGSRTWTDRETMLAWFDRFPLHTRIVHGGCHGADEMAEQIAKEMGDEGQVYPADWSRGPQAGPERNQRMLDAEKPSRVIAFACVDARGELSRGTADMVRRALLAGVAVTIVPPGARP